MTLREILKIHSDKILAGQDLFLKDGDGHHCILYHSRIEPIRESRIAIQYEKGYTFAVYPEHTGFEVVDIQPSVLKGNLHNWGLVKEHLKWDHLPKGMENKNPPV